MLACVGIEFILTLEFTLDFGFLPSNLFFSLKLIVRFTFSYVFKQKSFCIKSILHNQFIRINSAENQTRIKYNQTIEFK